jgi:hypothetical protein
MKSLLLLGIAVALVSTLPGAVASPAIDGIVHIEKYVASLPALTIDWPLSIEKNVEFQRAESPPLHGSFVVAVRGKSVLDATTEQHHHAINQLPHNPEFEYVWPAPMVLPDQSTISYVWVRPVKPLR